LNTLGVMCYTFRMCTLHLSDAARLLGATTRSGRINHAALARAFSVSRYLPRTWGGILPELYARRMLDWMPQAREYVIDPQTRMTLIEMRVQLRARAPPEAH
jgi:hypothetical protein